MLYGHGVHYITCNFSAEFFIYLQAPYNVKIVWCMAMLYSIHEDLHKNCRGYIKCSGYMALYMILQYSLLHATSEEI